LADRRGSAAAADGTGTVGLREVAEHLGLSIATVSRVLNRSASAHRISARTQALVLEAAEALRYEPNHLARALRRKKTYTMGVIVPEISEGYSASVLGGIEAVLVQSDYFYLVVSHHHRETLLDRYPRLLLSRGVEGLIAIDTPLARPLPVPVVAVSGHQSMPNVTTLAVDHGTAARMALAHLVDLGHRRIAFIKGQECSSDTQDRWQAIERVGGELGLRVDERLCVQLASPEAGSGPGRVATAELLGRGAPFTAIFAFNDLSAIGAIAELRAHGIAVPRDVSVVGFDDIPGAASHDPALTTVRQPLRSMGEMAAGALLGCLDPAKRQEIPAALVVQPEFIVRSSTAPVRGAV
jgi:LacI family transcriptional regulator